MRDIATYTPSALAANDLYKRHLVMIKDFVETSHTQREHTVSSIQNSMRLPKISSSYTTFGQTKKVPLSSQLTSKYIRNHAPKTLSFEEALAQVRNETRFS